MSSDSRRCPECGEEREPLVTTMDHGATYEVIWICKPCYRGAIKGKPFSTAREAENHIGMQRSVDRMGGWVYGD